MYHGAKRPAAKAAGLAALWLSALLCGCAGLVEKTGRVLDGAAFQEKTLAVYRTMDAEAGGADGTALMGMELSLTLSRGGEEFLLIKLEAFPAVILRCSAPDQNGTFYFISLEYFEAGYSGWNEFSMALSGSGKLGGGEHILVLALDEKPEPAQITSGRIRHGNNRIAGEQALSSLRNRGERIQVLCEWMRGAPGVPAFSNYDEFSAYWLPVLMPELSKRKRRPAGWKNNTEWIMAESVYWNANYTRELFPEELRILRNTGSLLRDWEEAPLWIYLIYEWTYLEKILAGELPLLKLK
jgi:hypothetical protein